MYVEKSHRKINEERNVRRRRISGVYIYYFKHLILKIVCTQAWDKIELRLFLLMARMQMDIKFPETENSQLLHFPPLRFNQKRPTHPLPPNDSPPETVGCCQRKKKSYQLIFLKWKDINTTECSISKLQYHYCIPQGQLTISSKFCALLK